MTEFTMSSYAESQDVWNSFFGKTLQGALDALRDAEDQYILDFFGGDIELVKRYGKDYYVEYSPLEMTKEDGKYSVTQTMRMKRRMEIHP